MPDLTVEALCDVVATNLELDAATLRRFAREIAAAGPWLAKMTEPNEYLAAALLALSISRLKPDEIDPVKTMAELESLCAVSCVDALWVRGGVGPLDHEGPVADSGLPVQVGTPFLDTVAGIIVIHRQGLGSKLWPIASIGLSRGRDLLGWIEFDLPRPKGKKRMTWTPCCALMFDAREPITLPMPSRVAFGGRPGGRAGLEVQVRGDVLRAIAEEMGPLPPRPMGFAVTVGRA